jgi:expansin (peptidoglycan-binding protein)
MSIKNIIKNMLLEQSEEWVDIAPEDYIDLLKYVNGDGALIKRLPDYRGKKIKITGKLDLSSNKTVSNIDSIDYVDGDLDIGYTNITYFDKYKV